MAGLGRELSGATLYMAMGISPKHNYEFEQRPFYVTRDGKGKVVPGLFA